MQQFSSRDLMVSVLPEESTDRGGDCGDCTNQGTNTSTARRDAARDEDLAVLQEQLRAARD